MNGIPQRAAGAVIRGVAAMAVPVLPLATRMRLVTWAGRKRLPGQFHFSTALLSDLKRYDPNAFHRFLWSQHLAYAESYEVEKRFGAANIDPTRHMLLEDLCAALQARGIDPAINVRSVFEVGASLGFLLRHAETQVFPSATILKGLDIDAYAIEAGQAHLESLGSRVQLTAADMADADRVMGRRIYDVVLCCGVLMYLDEYAAGHVVESMLSHTGDLLGIVCLGHPQIDNADLERSEVRSFDGAFFHNLPRMIRAGGGRVVSNRGASQRTLGGSLAYVIVAEPIGGSRDGSKPGR